MRQIFILFTVLLVSAYVNAQSFYDTTYHPNGKISRYGIFDKEKKVWVQKHFYFNGNIADVHQYDSSDFMYRETIIAFNIDGSIALKYSSFKGRPSSDFEEYYSNGTLKQKGQFYNGFKSGKWFEYLPDGKLTNECLFKLSSLDSSFKEEITFMNIDSFRTTRMLCQWGEVDLSLGEKYQFININKFEFFYLTPSIAPVCTKKKKSKNGT